MRRTSKKLYAPNLSFPIADAVDWPDACPLEDAMEIDGWRSYQFSNTHSKQKFEVKLRKYDLLGERLAVKINLLG